ncbi:hypothetical protein [Ethanoligenens harbinense]|uniref:Uncharacterized protein n=1 Tax=Ethanoligenens harbinense (strain DSM 18485 / JCM 12961 / CGMCC 1.5033 / YUAN-3) TaxID=663278 RepID=E6UA38_ETHHY|nr:hypothetical protein [Ethanoligenens harbinense]ADU27399.1 hypothetical protein Ethha_1877 [Ethanoligenens harbinense YUAN-3]AVQ96458.1 hypothetical protein CXQ68_09610 [Ethanoligenens harbinense YUAN-3]AYF39117.1 hypothetical protein CXP51_09480 [Ethanoligenens harbinense]AYF41943.1 hypothetical protein CN246_10050 [Ethanoligenens harbinense]QCN92699.1 hypothetical protein DRA42_09640 [Ethanoligenens harbinense]
MRFSKELHLVNLPAGSNLSAPEILQTEIDGCSVTMHFAAASNDTAMKQVRETLKGAYLRSISE